MHLRSVAEVARRACTTRLFGVLVAVGIVCANQTAYALTDANQATHKLARRLVTQFWNDVKHQDVKAYSHLLAPHFQGINISGVYTRSDQISGLQSLTVTKFKITKLIASRFNSTLVISYDFSAKGKDIVSGPCIDVWHKNGPHWKQVSHTYVPFQ